METGEEKIDDVSYYWAEPPSIYSSGPRLPWDAVVTNNVNRINWCIKSFGVPGMYHQKHERWFMWHGKFYFQNEHDRAIFILKWT